MLNPNNHPAIVERNQKREIKALRFAREAKKLGAPKLTVIKSLMSQYGLKTREARRIYKEAK